MKNLTTTLLLLITLGISPAIFALGLSEAKNSGLVGETPSGYLAAVKQSAGVNGLVSNINSKRRQHYQSISQRNGASLSTIERLAGKKAMQKTSAGNYIKANGRWVRK